MWRDHIVEKIVISTHTPLARRDVPTADVFSNHVISTHTPLARRDILSGRSLSVFSISTHTPLARRDRKILCFCDHTSL